MKQKPDKPKLWDIVQIDWLDSMHVAGWQHYQNVKWYKNAEHMKHSTVGFLSHQSKETVTVIQSLTDRWTNGNPTNVDAVMCIPRCSITSVTVLARKHKK